MCPINISFSCYYCLDLGKWDTITADCVRCLYQTFGFFMSVHADNHILFQLHICDNCARILQNANKFLSHYLRMIDKFCSTFGDLVLTPLNECEGAFLDTSTSTISYSVNQMMLQQRKHVQITKHCSTLFEALNVASNSEIHPNRSIIQSSASHPYSSFFGCPANSPVVDAPSYNFCNYYISGKHVIGDVFQQCSISHADEYGRKYFARLKHCQFSNVIPLKLAISNSDDVRHKVLTSTTKNYLECSISENLTIPKLHAYKLGFARPNTISNACISCHKFACSCRSDLVEHISIQPKHKPYSCSECGKSFPKKTFLNRHQLTHSALKPYSCPTCGKSFKCKYGLKQHALNHLPVKPYPCSTCGKCFSNERSLNVHTLTHSGLKPYSCPTCDKSFTFKANLQTHSLVHLAVKSYSCSICEKSYANKCSLKTHMLLHGECRPYSCSTCGKLFLNQSGLKSHIAIHSALKPFSCLVCNKSFSHRSSLTAHTITHSEIRPYSCAPCNKFFSSKRGLKAHMAWHSGLKSFQCLACDKSFYMKGNLKKHMRVHSGFKPHSCSTCNKTYTKKMYLKKHIEKIHKCDDINAHSP